MAILRVGLKVLNPPEDADKVLTGGLSFLASALFSWTARAKAASLTTSTLRKAAASRTHLARPLLDLVFTVLLQLLLLKSLNRFTNRPAGT